MNTHFNKTQENKSQFASKRVIQKKENGKSTIHLADNRKEANIQRKLKEITNNSIYDSVSVQFGGFGLGKEINPVMVQTGLPQVQNILIHPDYNRALPMITGAFAKLNNDHRHIELAMKIQLLQRVLNNPNVTQEEFGNVRHAVSGLLANLRSEHHIAEQEYEIARKERLKNQGN